MRGSLPTHRSLDVAEPFAVYRIIGFRPSSVYVDAERNATTGPGGDRLWDLVFEEAMAVEGDQVSDRPGGTVLLKGTGQAFAIQLSQPTARTSATAFNHADLSLRADRRRIDTLLVSGHLVAGAGRRPSSPHPLPPKTRFDEGQPLVSAGQEPAAATAGTSVD